MQLLEDCAYATTIDVHSRAVARDDGALNRRRSRLDPRAEVGDQSRAVRDLDDSEKSAHGMRRRADDSDAMRDLDRALRRRKPLSQLDVDRAEVLGQTLTPRFGRERRRQYASGDADRVLRDAQFVAQPSFDLKHPLRRRGRRDRVHGDRLVPRAKSQRTADALIEARGIPRADRGER